MRTLACAFLLSQGVFRHFSTAKACSPISNFCHFVGLSSRRQRLENLSWKLDLRAFQSSSAWASVRCLAWGSTVAPPQLSLIRFSMCERTFPPPFFKISGASGRRRWADFRATSDAQTPRGCEHDFSRRSRRPSLSDSSANGNWRLVCGVRHFLARAQKFRAPKNLEFLGTRPLYFLRNPEIDWAGDPVCPMTRLRRNTVKVWDTL